MSYRPSRKRKPRPEDLTYERDLQATIRQAASLLGYLVYHTYDSRRSPEGFPDLIIAGHGKLYIWELKSQDGHPTDAQAKWLHTLHSIENPPDARLIRPTDLDWCLKELQEGARSSR